VNCEGVVIGAPNPYADELESEPKVNVPAAVACVGKLPTILNAMLVTRRC
jgi:hypothetical protein